MSAGGYSIMIVDDSAMFRLRVSCILQDFNLHPVLHAHDYEEACHLLLSSTVHAVLLDIGLPGKSGIELLKLIRKNYPHIRVLVVTNHSNDYYRKVCMLSGADDFFDKSHDFERIAQALQTMKEKELL